MASERVETLVGKLTLEEKISMLAGSDAWHTPGIERLGIPALKMTDGPVGARGATFGADGATSACFPCGTALAATWDVELVGRVGEALAQEARSKGAQILLAPTVNIHRTPLAGRNFECYSEDPWLASRIAVAYIAGVQSQGVGACVKHYVCNDQEHERHTISAQVRERAIREIYMPPFEAAVKEAGTWSMMAAYNKVNGTYASEHPDLLTRVLRDEWGWDGFVVSDWGATHSTVEAVTAGLDVEMPGPPRHFGEALVQAVRDGRVAESVIDEAARRALVARERTGLLDATADTGPERSDDRPEHREVALRAATQAAVLLRNDPAVLPLDASSIRTLALIGPSAATPRALGGGSAQVRPHYVSSLAEALAARLPNARIVHEPGCIIDRGVPVVDGRWTRCAHDPSSPGLTVEYFEGTDLAGEPVQVQRTDRASLTWRGDTLTALPGKPFSVRLRATFTPRVTGTHAFGLSWAGKARLLVDGREVVDGWTVEHPDGEAFRGRGKGPVEGQAHLEAGEPVELVAEMSPDPERTLRAISVQCAEPAAGDLMDRAVQAARDADAAVVVIGTSAEWESEGFDRAHMDLPGEQAELARRVAAANPRTAVVLNIGAPVTTDWAADVPSVLCVWFAGQEAGNAIAALLLGDANPSGKLPTTFPRRLQDNPSYLNYPGERGEVHYGEGVFVGYRHYDALDIDPAFAFGHGLSYTRFDYGPVRVSAAELDPGQTLTVEVDVTNAGQRTGAEVVQVYVRDVQATVARPPKELKGFARLHLEPGQTATTRIELTPRAFSFYDAGAHAWLAEAGDFEILVGSSSRDIRSSATVRLREPWQQPV